MPPRSKVDLLPDDVREELEKRLVGSAFSGYREHAEWLRSKGYEIRKSALAAWGSNHEDQMKVLKLATEEAKAVVAALPDQENAMNDALIRYVQHRLYAALKDGTIDLSAKELSSIARAIADVGRSAIAQKRYMNEVREKGAAVIDEMAKASGMNEEQAALWRSKFLGISAPS